ncbi:Putative ribonuclease H protein At1g65750 [Linum perenne]
MSLRNLKSSSPLWRGIKQEWGTMLAGAKSAIRDGTSTLFWTELGLKFGVLCWFLWKARNERIFAGVIDIPATMAIKCNRWLNLVNKAMEREAIFLGNTGTSKQSQIAWMARPRDGVTLNTDGSVLGYGGKASAGGLIRDCHGQCLQAFAMNLGRCTITRGATRCSGGTPTSVDFGI